MIYPCACTFAHFFFVQCNRMRVVNLLSKGVTSLVNETVVAILGGGCSSATKEIATATNGSLPLVSSYYNTKVMYT